jgi:hypothetical protein
MTEKREPYTERDFSELSRKLKTLGKDLTPKENAFLTEVVESSRSAIGGGEVKGFGGAPYDAQGYTPESTGGPESVADVAIKIVVKGTFVSK